MAEVPRGLIPWGPNNPPPRPTRKTLGSIIRKSTLNGTELQAFALRVLRGEHVASYPQKDPLTGMLTFIDGPPPIDQQMRALEWLAKYSHSVPKEPDRETSLRAEMAGVLARVQQRLSPEVFRILVTNLDQANEEANGITDGTTVPVED